MFLTSLDIAPNPGKNAHIITIIIYFICCPLIQKGTNDGGKFNVMGVMCKDHHIVYGI